MWDNLIVYAFPPFSPLRQILSRELLSMNISLIVVAPLWPQKEWFADLLVLLTSDKEPLNLILPWNLLIQCYVKKFHGPGVNLSSHVEVIKWLVSKVGFSKVLAEVLSPDLRRPTACLYQGKWSRYLHWCHGGNIAPCKTTSTDNRALLVSAKGAETIGSFS